MSEQALVGTYNFVAPMTLADSMRDPDSGGWIRVEVWQRTSVPRYVAAIYRPTKGHSPSVEGLTVWDRTPLRGCEGETATEVLQKAVDLMNQRVDAGAA